MQTHLIKHLFLTALAVTSAISKHLPQTALHLCMSPDKLSQNTRVLHCKRKSMTEVKKLIVPSIDNTLYWEPSRTCAPFHDQTSHMKISKPGNLHHWTYFPFCWDVKSHSANYFLFSVIDICVLCVCSQPYEWERLSGMHTLLIL